MLLLLEIAVTILQHGTLRCPFFFCEPCSAKLVTCTLCSSNLTTFQVVFEYFLCFKEQKWTHQVLVIKTNGDHLMSLTQH
ncbi:hypothetical protein K7X08_036250 [Anisodus acutangulus]|uniref:Secreted protein n=1 Tax=Anisodus acutangulus TaxID=402998 RepID=A0A9Q1L6R9_9SOLA|nr:hypothetical protein K7X08_036250 [Anisodus acutangulus]